MSESMTVIHARRTKDRTLATRPEDEVRIREAAEHVAWARRLLGEVNLRRYRNLEGTREAVQEARGAVAEADEFLGHLVDSVTSG